MQQPSLLSGVASACDLGSAVCGPPDFRPPGNETGWESVVEFQVDGSVLGKVDPRLADVLCSTSVPTARDGPSKPVFEMASPSSLTLSEETAGITAESRTRAVARVTEELRRIGVVTNWRDELYPVSDSFYNEPVFLIERGAADLLGVLNYGVHINGFVKQDVTTTRRWIPR